VSSRPYEKLGAFYLGRAWDPRAARATDELILYDSKDLTTHAVCVGMTGSGKTGLCVALLEEAAIDGIPAIAIDPKGDLGNLLLTFPELRPEDFRPWIDPAEAARAGQTVEQHANAVAERWRRGLGEWDQDAERIARLRAAADLALYTPGSTAGRPLQALRSLAAPSAAVAADADALRERVQASASGLLALLGIEADPIRSREHILLSTLVDRAWREGRSLELGALVAEIQRPPFERLGVMDLESFFPAADRMGLALALNGLLASPGFGAWLEGEPLDVGRLLYTAEGRPRLSVISIAHLSDRERMFFVTLLLGEVIAWMRGQPGTSSLRAILYMDEVFGYFPPVAEPPSKAPMLTLLKQARAFGLGVVLSTQNPVDLDYKGLSNAGTWFLGRLQTERDKARVLDGLEGATLSAGAAFDRAEIDRTLSALGQRVFLLHDVHEDRPVLFQTRWAMSYLRGPLTPEQIRRLARETSPATGAGASGAATTSPAAPAPATATSAARPLVPPDVEERFASARSTGGAGRLVYRPALLARARLHYVDRRAALDRWDTLHLLAPLGDRSEPWADAEALAEPPALVDAPEAAAGFGELPARAARGASYAQWRKDLAAWLQRERPLRLFESAELRQLSAPGESEGEFRGRLTQHARERRDLEVEKLRARYAPKLRQLAERVRAAEERVERERSQQQSQTLQTAVSLGATVLGALFGRRLGSASSIGRATTTLRGAARTAREREDVARASDRVEQLRSELAAMEAEFESSTGALSTSTDPASISLTPYDVAPRKSDLAVESLALLWVPWRIAADGSAERAI
jgi:hypothetical protein